MTKRDDQERLQRLADAAGREDPSYVSAGRPPGLALRQQRDFVALDAVGVVGRALARTTGPVERNEVDRDVLRFPGRPARQLADLAACWAL
jgi:hypothetical protein